MGYRESMLDALREYDGAVQEVQKNRRVFDGVLGLGNHPGSAPCHDALDRQAEALWREAAEAGDLEAAEELVNTLFRAETEWKGPEYARLMLVAVQRHAIPLIPLMEKGARDELSDWYQKQYPRRKRLPVQDEVLAALTGSEGRKKR